MMPTPSLVAVLTLASVLLPGPSLLGQAPAAPTPPAPPRPPAPPSERGPRTSLDVQVVIVRTQGDRVVSRLPYSLEVTTNASEAVLNVGSDVPVPTTTLTPVRPAALRPSPGGPPGAGAGQPAPPQGPPPDGVVLPPQSVQAMSYRSVGTVISCRATAGEAGQYELTLSVDDTAVLPRDASSTSGLPEVPAFRSFRARNALLLRDGQTRTFAAAADRISGEVVRVEVTLRVLKN